MDRIFVRLQRKRTTRRAGGGQTEEETTMNKPEEDETEKETLLQRKQEREKGTEEEGNRTHTQSREVRSTSFTESWSREEKKKIGSPPGGCARAEERTKPEKKNKPHIFPAPSPQSLVCKDLIQPTRPHTRGTPGHTPLSFGALKQHSEECDPGEVYVQSKKEKGRERK